MSAHEHSPDDASTLDPLRAVVVICHLGGVFCSQADSSHAAVITGFFFFIKKAVITKVQIRVYEFLHWLLVWGFKGLLC